MPEWDPYYLGRGMYRAMAQDQTREGRWAEARQAEVREEIKRERAADRAEIVDHATSVATIQQNDAFRRKLDTYEAANTEALIRNSEDLARAREVLQAFLARAYVHDDGRRLFKTRDGAQVFDEFGEDVTGDIDPDLIGGELPTWEEYLPALERRDALEAERTELLDAQQRLDAARDQLRDENLSASDLDALDAELGATLPIPVKGIVSGETTPAPERTAADPPRAAHDLIPSP